MAWIRPSGKGRKRTWLAVWRNLTGDIRSRGGFTRKQDAIDYGNDRESDIRRGIYVDPSDLKRAAKTTLGDFYSAWRWLAGERAEKSPSARPASSTLAMVYDTNWPFIESTFGATPLGRIARHDVQRWLDALESDRSYWRARDALRVLRALLNHAIRQDPPLLQANPAAGMRLAEPETKDPAILTPKEIDHLADTLEDRWRAFVLVMAWAQLRPSEAVALRVDRVDWLRNAIRVEEKMTEHNGRLFAGAPKTRRSRRRVAVPSFVIEELSAHLARYPASDDGLIFHDAHGKPIRLSNFRRRHWRPALEKAGLDETFPVKNLRHTGASLALAAGAPRDYVAARLGHVGTQMIERHYRAFIDDIERDIADRLGATRETAKTQETRKLAD